MLAEPDPPAIEEAARMNQRPPHTPAVVHADVASPELRWRLPRLLEWRDADVICLNATDAAPDANRARLVDFLGRYFS